MWVAAGPATESAFKPRPMTQSMWTGSTFHRSANDEDRVSILAACLAETQLFSNCKEIVGVRAPGRRIDRIGSSLLRCMSLVLADRDESDSRPTRLNFGGQADSRPKRDRRE